MSIKTKLPKISEKEYLRLKQESEQFAALAQAIESLRITGKEELIEVINDVSRTIGEALGTKGIAIWAATEHKKYLKMITSQGLNKEYEKYFHDRPYNLLKGKGAVLAQAFLERKSAYTTNIWEDKDVIDAIPKPDQEMIRREGYISVASLPIVIEDETYGVINFYFPTPHTYPKSERQILQVAVNAVSTAIGNIQYKQKLNHAQDALKQERDQLAKLQAATESLRIAPGRSLEEVLEELASTIGRAIGTQAIAVWTPNEDQKSLKIFVSKGLTEQYIRIFDKKPLSIAPLSIVGRAALEKKPVFSNDVRKEANTAELTEDAINTIEKQGVISVASLPLLVSDKLFGVLNFYFSTPHSYSAAERYILQVAANITAIAVENTQQREELNEIQHSLANTLKDTEVSREKAEEEKNKTDLIIKNFSDGILVFNKNMELEILNTRAQALLGVNAESVLGRNISDIAPELHLESALPAFEQEANLLAGTEVPLPHDVIAEVTSLPIVNARNEKFGILLVIHDVTREKRVEQLKTEFVSLAAHQLRTPLSAIKWSFDILLSEVNKNFTEQQVKMLEIGYQSNERMIALINELLDVTRIEEGKYLQNPSPQDLKPLIEEMINSKQDDAKRRGVSLNLAILSENIPLAMVDKEKFKLSIENLVDNALHYTPQNGTISVSMDFKPEKSEFEIKVKDSGIGIPVSQQSRVFQRFFRATNAVKVHTTGTGLGLYICKNIIEAHGGKIWFESQEGTGTTFFVTIPVEKQ